MKQDRASPDLGVAHEAIAQTDGETVGLERGVVVGLSDGVHVGGIGVLDGVSLDALDGSNSPSVVDAGGAKDGERKRQQRVISVRRVDDLGRDKANGGRKEAYMRQTLSVKR